MDWIKNIGRQSCNNKNLLFLPVVNCPSKRKTPFSNTSHQAHVITNYLTIDVEDYFQVFALKKTFKPHGGQGTGPLFLSLDVSSLQ